MLAVGGSACTYVVNVHEAPSDAAYAFEGSLPARLAVFVDADQLYREVRPFDMYANWWCSDSKYPLDARGALPGSVLGTLDRLVAEVELTANPVGRRDMVDQGFDGVIVVRADTFDASLGTKIGAFEARAHLTLSVSVFTEEGLLIRDVMVGEAVQNGDSHDCDEGAELLGGAMEIAIRNSMTALGELVVNSPELRFTFDAEG